MFDELRFQLRAYSSILLSGLVVLAIVAALWGVFRASPNQPTPFDSSTTVTSCVTPGPCLLDAPAPPLAVSVGEPVVLAGAADRVVSVSLSSHTGASITPPRIADGVLYTGSLPTGSYDLVLVFESGLTESRRLEVLPSSTVASTGSSTTSTSTPPTSVEATPPGA